MEKHNSSGKNNSGSSLGYHDGTVETVISVEDVNRKVEELSETVSIEKIAGL